MDERTSQIALVTGGCAGLGNAVAMELARAGFSLCLQAEPDQPTEGVAEELAAAAKAAGRNVEAVCETADLTDSSDRERIVESLLDSFDRVDLLVNAAPGVVSQAADLLEVSEETYRRAIDAGLTATFFLTQLVANEMVRLVDAGLLESPRIVTINSIGAYATSVDHGPQCIGRAGVGMVTRLFADRLGEYGIGVYEVRVGLISSGAGDPAHQRYDALIDQGLTPLRRWGRPEDVARAVLAVAEGKLDFSTGQVIDVDGGFHLRRL